MATDKFDTKLNSETENLTWYLHGLKNTITRHSLKEWVTGVFFFYTLAVNIKNLIELSQLEPFTLSCLESRILEFSTCEIVNSVPIWWVNKNPENVFATSPAIINNITYSEVSCYTYKSCSNTSLLELGSCINNYTRINNIGCANIDEPVAIALINSMQACFIMIIISICGNTILPCLIYYCRELSWSHVLLIFEEVNNRFFILNLSDAVVNLLLFLWNWFPQGLFYCGSCYKPEPITVPWLQLATGIISLLKVMLSCCLCTCFKTPHYLRQEQRIDTSNNNLKLLVEGKSSVAINKNVNQKADLINLELQ